MKYLVSACLLGVPCKYNGGDNACAALKDFLRDQEVVAVCPEVLGGLPIPRTPVELKDGVAWTRDGKNVQQAFVTGAQAALNIALCEGVEVAILQSRSPSCGAKQIYDGTFTGKKIDGQGIFACMLVEHGIRVVDVEDILKTLNGF